jgi:predicted ester cyclase
MPDNKDLARRIPEALNSGNLGLLNEAIDPNWVIHDPGTPDVGRGPEGAKKYATLYRNAFPDANIAIHQQLAEGEWVASRWTGTGTQRGALGTIAPTGKKASVEGITIDRIRGGKIVETWSNWDTMGLMQQLGVAPSPQESGRR